MNRKKSKRLVQENRIAKLVLEHVRQVYAAKILQFIAMLDCDNFEQETDLVLEMCREASDALIENGTSYEKNSRKIFGLIRESLRDETYVLYKYLPICCAIMELLQPLTESKVITPEHVVKTSDRIKELGFKSGVELGSMFPLSSSEFYELLWKTLKDKGFLVKDFLLKNEACFESGTEQFRDAVLELARRQEERELRYFNRKENQ